MSIRKLATIAVTCMVGFLAACGTSSPTASGSQASSRYPATSQSSNLVSGLGVVQAIDVVPRESSGGIGIGTVAGAVVGGVLGNQIGSGTGRTAATVAGAAGGAYAGHAYENRNKQGQSGQVYRISLRMDDGTLQSMMQESSPSLRVGDRVRISNGVIERM